jgi:hypothetical protein
VVPGPIYGDGDWLAFADIDNAIFDAALDGSQASILVEEMQRMFNQEQKLEAIVQQMIKLLPPLAKGRPALLNNAQRGLRMLTTLLVARSRDQPLTAADAARAGNH